MARIAVGGWQHETNTFATFKAGYDGFTQADEWPGMSQGQALFENTRGVHLPITGAIESLKSNGHALVPLLWCSATPCAHVTEDAFERICTQMLEMVKQSLPLDGIYLDLHGAMVCEHLEDGEGEFLSRLRKLVGKDLPVVVSLDLHANVTPAMVEHATLIDIYRTYPHIDMGETGSRAALSLDRLIKTGEQIYPAFKQLEFLIPLNDGCTLIEPCQGIYRELPNAIGAEIVSASFACGFQLSDIYDVGPSVVVYGLSQSAADRTLDTLYHFISDQRAAFHQKIWPAKEGVSQALKFLQQDSKTIVLADTQDNPGGGGSGDTTGLLQAMMECGVKNGVFGIVSDRDTVERAWQTEMGGSFNAMLGGKSGLPGQAPFPCECKILGFGDGNFTATGPMYKGARMSIGKCALVETAGIKVALCSKPVQAADQSMFRHFGLEPSDMSIVALKSSVHFRNDFTELASEILIVSAPGAVFADPASLDYQNKRPTLALK